MNEALQKLKEAGQAYRNASVGISEAAKARMDLRMQQILLSLPQEEISGWRKAVRVLLALRFSSMLLPRPVRMVLKPAFSVAAFVVIASFGWMTAMTAFSGVLPGDSLYGMKLASERAHLRFITNPENKAELEFEFASRRLNEIAKITEGSYPDRNARVSVAAEQFKSQIATAKSKMRNLRTTNQSDAVAVAKIVDRKLSEYQVTLDHATELLSGSGQDSVREAKDAAQDASFVAVTLLLEETGNVSFEEVRRRVGEKLHELEESIQEMESGIWVLPNEAYPEVDAINGPTLDALRATIRDARKTLEEGKNFYAQGGFEAALLKYREGVGYVNQLDWGIGLYEQVLADRAKAAAEKKEEEISPESSEEQTVDGVDEVVDEE